VRILAVNIRSGGNASTTAALVARILRADADVVVISEFRDNPAGAKLRDGLRRAGFEHQAATDGHKGNGVLIASTEPLAATRSPFGLSDDEYPNAVMQTDIGSVRLFGVYLPGQDRKRVHLRCLIAMAQYCNEHGIDALAIGDFNSGRNATDIELNLHRASLADEFSTADLYAELEEHWTEAWAFMHPDEYEFSWYPFRSDPDYRSREGWRIDTAFVSRSLLPRLRSAEYDHFFRLDRLTDHSGIVVDLDV
jgi:exonuclease III